MSVQDMIKKSVLESGVFDSFNAPKMAISLIIASVSYTHLTLPTIA